jgi:hypothetical protein
VLPPLVAEPRTDHARGFVPDDHLLRHGRQPTVPAALDILRAMTSQPPAGRPADRVRLGVAGLGAASPRPFTSRSSSGSATPTRSMRSPTSPPH